MLALILCVAEILSQNDISACLIAAARWKKLSAGVRCGVYHAQCDAHATNIQPIDQQHGTPTTGCCALLDQDDCTWNRTLLCEDAQELQAVQLELEALVGLPRRQQGAPLLLHPPQRRLQVARLDL